MDKDGVVARLLRIESISETEKYTVAHDAERLEEYHAKLSEWQKETVTQLRASIARYGMKGNALSDSIQPTFHKDKYGIVNRLGFSFERHGVYVHRGAGRGQGGYKGSKWTYIQQIKGNKINTGIIRHTNPESLGQMDAGNRTAKPWFDPVVASRLQALSDIVSEYWATMAIDATNIFIEK